MKNLFKQWNQVSLVLRIIIGLVVGIFLAFAIPEQAKFVIIFGSLFVGALKSIAPILVFFLIMSAISKHKSGHQTNMKSIIFLYLLGTFLAGLTAVVVSFMFPVTLTLAMAKEGLTPPGGVVEVLKALLMNVVDNPVKALFNANYIGILSWALVLGAALKNAPDTTKTMITNFSDAVTQIVKWVIDFAPLGIMGLVFQAISENGITALASYGRLLVVLIGCMLFVALVVNPIIVYIYIRKKDRKSVV